MSSVVPLERMATIWSQRRCWSRPSLFAGVTNSLRPVGGSLASQDQDQPGLLREHSPAQGESLRIRALLASCRRRSARHAALWARTRTHPALGPGGVNENRYGTAGVRDA